MGIALCVVCCFSLAAFNICFMFDLCEFDLYVSWGVLPWIYPVWDSLGVLDLGGYFLPHLGKFSTIIYPSIFSCPFFYVFFWDSYDSNVGVFNIFLEVSEIVLISFNSFFFFSSLIHLFLPFYLLFH